MFSPPPDGYLLRNLIMFNHPGRFRHVARGFQIDASDYSQAQPGVLNRLHDQVALLLRGFDEHQRLQFRWHCDSDYARTLDAYDVVTAATTNEWAKFHRGQKSRRYRELMAANKLRRERLVIYVSRAVDSVPHLRRTDQRTHAVIDQALVEFDHFHQRLVQLFGPFGFRITPLTDEEHFRQWFRHFNPSLADRPGYDPVNTFDPTRSLQENCWLSEGVGQADAGYWMDGYYHGLLAVSRWPRTTYPGIIRRLTGLPLLNYEITLNVEPLSVRAEIAREEQGYRRIQGDLASEQKVGLERVLEKKKTKVKQLMEGFLRPLRAELILRTWAKTASARDAQMVTLKQAINSMNGAGYFEPSLFTSAKRLSYQILPGHPNGSYQYQRQYAQDDYTSDLVPISTSFTGALDGAEALYDGPHGSLVGVRAFAGQGAHVSPQHAMVVGKTGSGKGVLLIDFLSQLLPYLGFTVIIDYGLSYELFVRTIDPAVAPIIIHPNSQVTLNYLDTQGLPVTPEHLASAAGLVMMMLGNDLDSFEQRHRQAVVSKYLQRLYQDVFEDWARAHPGQALEVARLALALAQRRNTEAGSVLDAYVDFRDWQAAQPDEAAAQLAHLDEGQVLAFLKSPTTRQEVCQLAFTRFTPETMPTHQMLQELMRLDAGSADSLAGKIADLLAAWCRHGQNGVLFDGVSNVSLHRRVAYFELGQMQKANAGLRAAASYVVMNHVQRHIAAQSRAVRKALIFEEASAFLTMPRGEEILREAYEQARKFNCWLAAVFQGYERIRESGIGSALMGNARQFFLLAQKGEADLSALAAELGLSDTTLKALREYPEPGLKSADAHFTHFQSDHPPTSGTTINVGSPELLYVAGSSGEHVERRRKDFGGDYRDLVPRIVKFAHPSS